MALGCFLFSGCFIFYGGSLDGFTVEGIYDGADMLMRCPDAEALLQWSSDSFETWPDDEENCGSIVYPIGTECFASDTRSGFNAFAFISPALTSWNDVTGFLFRMKASIPGSDPIGHSIEVQPMLEIEKPGGARVFHRMVDEDDRPIMFDIPNDAHWHTFTYARPVIDPEDTVIGLSVVVYVPNGVVADLERIALERGHDAEVRGFVYLDAVVPVRS